MSIYDADAGSYVRIPFLFSGARFKSFKTTEGGTAAATVSKTTSGTTASIPYATMRLKGVEIDGRVHASAVPLLAKLIVKSVKAQKGAGENLVFANWSEAVRPVADAGGIDGNVGVFVPSLRDDIILAKQDQVKLSIQLAAFVAKSASATADISCALVCEALEDDAA